MAQERLTSVKVTQPLFDQFKIALIFSLKNLDFRKKFVLY